MAPLALIVNSSGGALLVDIFTNANVKGHKEELQQLHRKRMQTKNVMVCLRAAKLRISCQIHKSIFSESCGRRTSNVFLGSDQLHDFSILYISIDQYCNIHIFDNERCPIFTRQLREHEKAEPSADLVVPGARAFVQVFYAN
jgi:hypothetical protein